MIVIRGGTDKPVSSQRLANYFEQNTDFEGYLYLGYPIIGVVDGGYKIDALLISEQHGAIIFHLIEGAYDNEVLLEDIQDESYTKFESKLKIHKELTYKRKLSVKLSVPIFAPAWTENHSKIISDYPILVCDNDLNKFLNSISWDNPEKYKKLVSVIQSITTIRRRNKRSYVKNPESRGAKLKALEDSIATLDRYQSRAVIETVEGVQRIRGLAGSGKTIVLALKVAYLHAKNPNWKIAVTFNSRALKNQFRHFITLFTLEHINEEPDWDRIDIIHAWGSPSKSGIYYELCFKHNIEYLDFKSAESLAKSYGKGFDTACEKAYSEIKNYQQYYDMILVDEAQDFSPYFLRLCYNILQHPKRLVYAYDELQNISNKQMPSPEELFGSIKEKPIVTLENIPGKSKQDIVLDVCYRNSRPLLATAHALGFGIYREKGLIQMFEQHQLWKDVGYKVKDGKLEDGQNVTLCRDEQSSPNFLEKHSDIDDLILFKTFSDSEKQTEYLISEIEKNITKDELKLDDIMVIHPDPYTAKQAVGAIRSELFNKNINSNLAGVTTTPDEFFSDDAVVFTQIYRAKGNEASMVYIINAHECFDAPNRTQKRNMLFTGLTRSKAWVRVIGYGSNMEKLQKEFEEVKRNNFELKFLYPTAEQRENLNVVNRDVSEQERKNQEKGLSKANDLLNSFEAGELFKEDLDKNTRDKLIKRLL